MTKIKKIITLVILLMISFVIFNTNNYKSVAETTNVSNKKKIVSVVFDNSGSMITVPEEQREQYAKYSLQTLIGLLDKEDTLFITPMNVVKNDKFQNVSSINDTFEVDLKQNRADAIKKALNTIAPAEFMSNGTPVKSVDIAIEKLVSPGKNLPGLPSLDDYYGEEENSNYEYWLIILTDGSFDKISGAKNVSKALEDRIKKYSSLNTIYYSFGSAAPNLENENITKNYSFTSYIATEGADIVSQMQNVANKMSGRFSLEDKWFSVNGKKLTIDLDNFDLSFKSISIIAQNFGGVINSAKYNGEDVNVEENFVLEHQGITDFKSGCLAMFNNDNAFSGGALEIEFTAPINKNDVAILVQPSLYIEAYLEYNDNGKYIETDMQYINSHLTDKDKIRVQYRVYEENTGRIIDIESLFGKATTKVTYAGKSYVVNEDIPLVVGKNEISVDVNVEVNAKNKGVYSMHTSMMCIIDKNPTDYRVESEVINNVGGDITKHKVEYTVYVGGKPLKTKEAFKDYTIKIDGINPNGKKLNLNYVIKDNGKVEVDISTDKDIFGEHEINFKVTSVDKLSRTKKDTFTTLPSNIEVKVLNTSKLNISQFGLKSNTQEINFIAVNGDKEIDLASKFLTYRVKIDGKDVTEHVTQSGNKLTYIPTEDTLPNNSIGDKTIEVIVSNPTLGDFKAQYVFGITEIAYTIEVVESTSKVVDVTHINSSNAYVSFKILRDGVAIPYEEVVELYELDKIKIDINKGGWISLLPCGMNTTIEQDELGEPIITCKVYRDWDNRFFSWFGETFIWSVWGVEKDIKLTYQQATAVDTIEVDTLQFLGIIGRIVVLLAIVDFIVHTIFYVAYLLLFKQKHKRFDSGYFLKISLANDGNNVNYSKIGVNLDKNSLIWFYLKSYFSFFGVSYYQTYDATIHGMKLEYSKEDKKSRTRKKEQIFIVNKPHYTVKLQIDVDSDEGDKLNKFFNALKDKSSVNNNNYIISKESFERMILDGNPEFIDCTNGTKKYNLRRVKRPNAIIVTKRNDKDDIVYDYCITFVGKKR